MAKEKITMEKECIINFEADGTKLEDAEVAFDTLKRYQNIGVIDERSKVQYGKINVPAGMLESFEEFNLIYRLIVNGDISRIIVEMPEKLRRDQASYFIRTCVESRLNLTGEGPYDQRRIDSQVANYMDTRGAKGSDAKNFSRVTVIKQAKID